MCMAHEVTCKCGARSVSFHMRDSILPHEVVSALYCPSCSGDVSRDGETMLEDKGWIIEYDMDVARLMAPSLRRRSEDITPAFIFDEGYCSWNGLYPGEHIESLREREDIIKLARTNPKEYVNTLRDWSNNRMEKLRAEGWRKATVPAGVAG